MKVVLTAVKKIIPRPFFKLIQPIYHYGLAWLAALFYFFPSRKLTVIGVTGTDGKSSVVELIHEIFRASGASVASVSSLRFKINDHEEPNLLKMTMPGRFFIQSFLRSALKDGAKYVVLEATSEGIKQFRHKFVKFDAALLTNLTPEHIESHGSFEKYRAAKAKLFASLGGRGIAVLNRGDPSWKFFADQTSARVSFYGKDALVMAGHEYRIEALSYKNEIRFRINGVDFYSRLFGEFNVLNILAALTVAHSLGLSFEKISAALEKIPAIPGRLEIIQQEPFRVVVDYAHTPNALRNVYQTLRGANPKPETLNSKLICVLGSAGGGRDKWKRPEMGKIAEEFCDEIILTNEDPYDELPHEIIDQIATGIQYPAFSIRHLKKILDRREAIREALRLVGSGDTIIITGKGAEQWIMGPRNTKIPWDDRVVVGGELSKIPPAPH